MVVKIIYSIHGVKLDQRSHHVKGAHIVVDVFFIGWLINRAVIPIKQPLGQ